ncbi:MAG: hypothetical protein GX868_04670 [Actinobacteria bacterium]|nr:hypothetical protein [Actinomycetota bacterium]
MTESNDAADNGQPGGEAPRSIRPTAPPQMSAAKKYGPIVAIAVLLIGALVAVVLTSGGDDGDDVATGGGTATVASTEPPAEDGSDFVPRDGVDVFRLAKAEGRADDIDWGERCDTEIGALKLPIWPQPDCFKPYDGGDPGAPWTGVTADSIKVVVYLPQPNDPVLKFIYSQIGATDGPDQTWETFQGFVEIFSQYYELYGRTVELIRYDATGTIQDSAAAMADAETIARDIAPFAVLGGPNLTNAFADTLATNKVLCIACTSAQPADWYVERAPYVWDVGRNATQAFDMVAEYLGKRLAGHPAEYAGDESMHSTERVFGYLRSSGNESSQGLEDYFVNKLREDYGVEFATIQTYGLPTELAGSGKDIITAFKEAEVTSVVLSVDPLAPQTLTQIATQQEYFPEWVMGSSTLVDTAAFSRTYDQAQWAHAFGSTGLFTPTDTDVAGAAFLYKWFFGTEAPATSVALINGPLQVLFGAVQGVGPELTPQAFEEVLFNSPVYEGTPVNPQVSFGNRGFFDVTDYSGLDDMTEIWWDPTATGDNEIGQPGTGMWRYVDGGKRTLPGQWAKGRSKLFDPEGTVTVYTERPAGSEIKDYEPLR